MASPWTDGPRELIQHAADHLRIGGDFDRRIAMISVDNAVELIIKTYLGLPQRTRGIKGPSRRELETASESFPGLLDLLQTFAIKKITGLSLDDIEWYHRIRNQLYHSGNGITVEKEKVETYLQLAIGLFENLFGFLPPISEAPETQSRTGLFLQLWNTFDHGIRERLKQEKISMKSTREYLASIAPGAVDTWSSLYEFRAEMVHGLEPPDTATMNANITKLKRLLALIGTEF